MNYIYLAIAAAFLSLIALSKYQYDEIQDLKRDQAIWESKNKELADTITDQNTRLKDGAEKYAKVQSDLDTAKGANRALTNEYSKLRSDLNNLPLAKNCSEAITELSTQFKSFAKKWNTK